MDNKQEDHQIHGESNLPLYLAISLMFNVAMFFMFMLPEMLK